MNAIDEMYKTIFYGPDRFILDRNVRIALEWILRLFKGEYLSYDRIQVDWFNWKYATVISSLDGKINGIVATYGRWTCIKIKSDSDHYIYVRRRPKWYLEVIITTVRDGVVSDYFRYYLDEFKHYIYDINSTDNFIIEIVGEDEFAFASHERIGMRGGLLGMIEDGDYFGALHLSNVLNRKPSVKSAAKV